MIDIESENIDIEQLRFELANYYGTSGSMFFGPNISEALNVDNLSDEEVLNKASELGLIDLDEHHFDF